MLRAGFILSLVLVASAAGAASNPPTGAPRLHRFQHDGIMGTSVDLAVVCSEDAHAKLAEIAALNEIDRLAQILSADDPASDLSRLNMACAAVECPKELLEVLGLCEQWRQRSGGAFNAGIGRLAGLWKAAVKADRMPEPGQLADAVRELSQPAWSIDAAQGRAKRLGSSSLRLDALAKGYIIDKAMTAARNAAAGIRGVMLDIGGDIAVWGEALDSASPGPWRIGVADPLRPAENAPHLATLLLRDRAVATSGHYARPYVIQGKHYSHILDPRTGKPVEGVASCTVVAADCATADPLATALCVLGPDEGLRLVRDLSAKGIAAECLLVMPDGKQIASDGWKKLIAPAPVAFQVGRAAWPAGFELGISLTIARPRGRKTARPYVATWIENEKGEPVRTLAVWGREREYLRELTRWWSFARRDPRLVQSVTRASRGPGQYAIVWDGLDDKGKPVPPGKYTVRIESAREHGPHVVVSGTIVCDSKPASAKIDGNTELDETKLTFGPRTGSP